MNFIYLLYRELKYPNPNPNTNCLARNNSRQFEFENYRNPLHFHYLVKYLIGNIIKLHKEFGPNMQINPDHNRGTVQLLTVPIKTPL